MNTALSQSTSSRQFRGRIIEIDDTDITTGVSKKIKFDLRTLPAISKQYFTNAELMPHYVAQKAGMAELVRVDEVKDIADKHLAIACYARQLEEADGAESLLHYAERVYLRAIERIGELIKELGSPSEQYAAGKQYGLRTRAKIRQAVAITAVPKTVRNQMIERTPPPTVAELVTVGSRYNPPAPALVAVKRKDPGPTQGFKQLAADIDCIGKICGGWKLKHTDLMEDEARKLLRLLAGAREKFDMMESWLGDLVDAMERKAENRAKNK